MLRKSATKRVLLTSGRLPGSLELARSLAGAGAEVCVADSYPFFICQASRAVKRLFHVPPPRSDYEGYRQAILDIVQREKIDLVIPCSEDVFYLAAFRSELSKHCEVFFAESELLLDLHHKYRFVELCRSHDLAVPATVYYKPQMDLPSFTQTDYLIKQVYSRGGYGVIFAGPGSHPDSYGLPADGGWILQEKAKGEPVCSVSVVQNGRVLLTRLYRPASSMGTVSVGFCRAESSRIEAWIERFACATQYHGFVSFDFFESEDGIVAIECNPRLTSGIHLIDPDQLAGAILSPDQPVAPRTVRNSAQVLVGVLSALWQICREPGFLNRMIGILRTPDVIFSWHDPLPFFHQMICYLYGMKRTLSLNIPFIACTMEGVEWDEASHARVFKTPLV